MEAELLVLGLSVERAEAGRGEAGTWLHGDGRTKVLQDKAAVANFIVREQALPIAGIY